MNPIDDHNYQPGDDPGLHVPPVAPTHYRKRTKPGEVKPAPLTRFYLKGCQWLLGCGHLALYWRWDFPYQLTGYCNKCKARGEHKPEVDLGGEA